MKNNNNKQNNGQMPLPNVMGALEANQGPRPAGMPSLAVLKQETARLGLPDTDAEALYDVWLANGFRTKVGKIKSWKAVIRTYVRNKWLPSLKFRVYAPRDAEAEELARIKRAKEKQ